MVDGVDSEVAKLAERQHGVFRHHQVVALKVSPAAVKHRLGTGRWEAVHEGVYRLAGSAPTWHQRLMALTLAAGPVAAASHRSAATLLGIPGFVAERIEVSTPRPPRHRQSGVHRSRVLPPEHLTVVDGIATTRVPRTLFDLAAAVHPLRAERAVDNCLASGKVSLAALGSVTAELSRKGRTGSGLMRRLLEDRGAGYVAPASELEARFLDLVRSAGLPEPVRQVDLGDADQWIGRVDFAYTNQKVVIEVDGRRWHGAKLDVDSDQLRDQRLAAAGWRVVRIGWTQLTTRPDDVVALVRNLLRPCQLPVLGALKV
ncbi:MAG: DUF559 domain-containing protein, partial [Acidimicrobiales bacterium]